MTDVPTKVMLDFVCKPVGGQLCTSEETSDCRWVAKDQVLDMITAPAIRTRYQAYLNLDGKMQYMDYVTKPNFEVKLSRTI
ncbi:NUDIX hydrolase [Paenibacillus xylanivorans]|uniref:hypothetical protein n=1 Tax=Paenibacillus xylanivorans TaxID=1705561 RepID=UPI002E821632|nr:hypothetical protein [Paenibacillus xylanivorans]